MMFQNHKKGNLILFANKHETVKVKILENAQNILFQNKADHQNTFNQIAKEI